MADVSSMQSFPAIAESTGSQRLKNAITTAGNSQETRRESRRASTVSFGSLSSSADMRRRPTLRGATNGILGMFWMRRNTVASTSTSTKKEPPKVKLMNTYRLEPERGQIFSADKIRKTAEDVLKNYLENVTYNENTCGTLACHIADIIKNRVKDMNFPRYRIICHVIIAEEKGQGMEAASMYVWNDKTDNYACASYKNNSITAIATIHGVYLE